MNSKSIAGKLSQKQRIAKFKTGSDGALRCADAAARRSYHRKLAKLVWFLYERRSMNRDFATEPKKFYRYIPLAIWVLAIFIGFLIPMRILKYGYIPRDDATRHVAKAVADRPWSEILVMRPELASEEHHPGWQKILGALHHKLGWETDALMFFSVAGLFVLTWLAAFAFRKRPEAMLIALFISCLLAPATFSRLIFGRPFLIMTAVFLILLQLWFRAEKISPARLIVSTLLIAFSVWCHGSWYLFALPVAGFVLVGQWKKASAIFVCWMVGTLVGATLTGHPLSYIVQAIEHLRSTMGSHSLTRMLVTELRPDPGDLNFVFAMIVLLVWRRARGEWKREVVFNPLFAMAALGWLLGLKVARFWVDWGFPAALLWMATEFETILESRLARESLRSTALACVAAAGIYITATRDIGDRWTKDLTVEYLTPDNPDVKPWLSEKGGIIYSADMGVFFRTFYKNPHADWKYILGFEPGVMPQEDLEILRKIQWNLFTPKAYEPWVKKMRPEDRMILLQSAGAPPNIAGLEWHYAATETWVGRLPRKNFPGKAER